MAQWQGTQLPTRFPEEPVILSFRGLSWKIWARKIMWLEGNSPMARLLRPPNTLVGSSWSEWRILFRQESPRLEMSPSLEEPSLIVSDLPLIVVEGCSSNPEARLFLPPANPMLAYYIRSQ